LINATYYFAERYEATSLTFSRWLELSKKLSNEYFACRSRAQHLWRACKSIRDKGCARTAFQTSDEKVHRGRKGRTSLDGARTVISARSGSGNRFAKLALQGVPLFPQGVSPGYFRLGDADSVRPCWSSHRLCRLVGLSGRWHHRQNRRWHCRNALDRLRSHRASGWFDFGHDRQLDPTQFVQKVQISARDLAVPIFSSPTRWSSNDFGGGQRCVDL